MPHSMKDEYGHIVLHTDKGSIVFCKEDGMGEGFGEFKGMNRDQLLETLSKYYRIRNEPTETPEQREERIDKCVHEISKSIAWILVVSIMSAIYYLIES